jgi:DNA-binding NtrC family response regulator
MTQLALLVEQDHAFLTELGEVTERSGYESVRCGTFESARESLRTRLPDAVVTNIRLGMFNGIHLIYLSTVVRPDIRAVVYSSLEDPVLVREAQRACAFYERQRLVLSSLPNYLTASLPSRDRRDVQVLDRRQAFRGGRRATDSISVRDSSMSNQGSA